MCEINTGKVAMSTSHEIFLLTNNYSVLPSVPPSISRPKSAIRGEHGVNELFNYFEFNNLNCIYISDNESNSVPSSRHSDTCWSHLHIQPVKSRRAESSRISQICKYPSQVVLQIPNSECYIV